MIPKVVIEIKDGQVWEVYSDSAIEYVIVDRQEPSPLTTEKAMVIDPLHSVYGESELGKEISEGLKKINF